MLNEICRYLKNWFEQKKFFSTFTIENGTFQDAGESYYPGNYLQEGQYFRIVGSVLNDGIYQYPVTGLKDETFNGAIWAMAVPPDIIALSKEIQAWQEKYGAFDSASMSPYNSESFGGYSYSKSSAVSDGTGAGSWKSVFAARLSSWRKL